MLPSVPRDSAEADVTAGVRGVIVETEVELKLWLDMEVEGVDAVDMVIIGAGKRIPSRIDGLGPLNFPFAPDPAEESKTFSSNMWTRTENPKVNDSAMLERTDSAVCNACRGKFFVRHCLHKLGCQDNRYQDGCKDGPVIGSFSTGGYKAGGCSVSDAMVTEEPITRKQELDLATIYLYQ
jgi:hypothetical protein